MQYRVKTKVSKNGVLTLKGLPFQAGDNVEVIVQNHEEAQHQAIKYSLCGTNIVYTDPFESVSESDWRLFK